MSISWIALDMVGVIVDETKVISRVLWSQLPSDVAVARDPLKARYDDGLRLGRLSREEFWDGVASDGGWEALEESFLQGLPITAGAAAAIQSFADTYEMAVVSDLPGNWSRRILQRIGVLDVFSVCAFADEHHGARKGDGGLYRALRSAAGVPFSSIATVDDTPKNLSAAAKLGMRPVFFDRSGNADVLCDGLERRVTSFAELEANVESWSQT